MKQKITRNNSCESSELHFKLKRVLVKKKSSKGKYDAFVLHFPWWCMLTNTYAKSSVDYRETHPLEEEKNAFFTGSVVDSGPEKVSVTIWEQKHSITGFFSDSSGQLQMRFINRNHKDPRKTRRKNDHVFELEDIPLPDDGQDDHEYSHKESSRRTVTVLNIRHFPFTVFTEISAPGAWFLEAIQKHSENPSKPIGFVYSPLWKIAVFGGRLFRNGRLFRQTRYSERGGNNENQNPVDLPRW